MNRSKLIGLCSFLPCSFPPLPFLPLCFQLALTYHSFPNVISPPEQLWSHTSKPAGILNWYFTGICVQADKGQGEDREKNDLHWHRSYCVCFPQQFLVNIYERNSRTILIPCHLPQHLNSEWPLWKLYWDMGSYWNLKASQCLQNRVLTWVSFLFCLSTAF